MSKKDLDFWCTINAEDIKIALDTTCIELRLKKIPDFERTNSFWVKVLTNICIAKNVKRKEAKEFLQSETQLLWLYTVYKENRSNVSNLKDESTLDIGDDGLLKPNQSQNQQFICWCHKAYEETDPDCVECDKCNRWYHLCCLGLILEEVINGDYVCPFCKGENIDIPKILSLSKSGNPNLIHSANTTDKKPVSVFKKNDDVQTCAKRLDFDVDVDKPIVENQVDKPCITDNSENESDDGKSEDDEQLNKKDDDVKSETDQSEKEDCKFEEEDELETKPDLIRLKKDILTEEKDKINTKQTDEEGGESDGSIEEPLQQKELLNFNMKMPAADWSNCAPDLKGNKKDKLKLKENYTHIFDSNFRKHNSHCVLAFKKCVVNRPPIKSFFNFVRAYAVCTRHLCEAKYSFYIKTVPSEGKDVGVVVEGTGIIKHRRTEIKSRQLSRGLRVAAKEKLKKDTASDYRYAKVGETQQKQLNVGNFTDVYSLTTLRKCRSHAFKDDDLSTDVLSDCIQTRNILMANDPNSSCPGWIQVLSLTPTLIICFSEKQIHLLRNLLKRNSLLTLHIDATSNLVMPLPVMYDPKQIDLYQITTKCDMADTPPIVIAEMYTSDTAQPQITYFLSCVLHQFRLLTKNTELHYGISRWETDFAPSTIAAILKVSDMGSPLTYIQMCWKALETQNSTTFCVHICRWHAQQFLRKRIIASFKERTVVDSLKTLTYAYLNGKDLWSFCRRARDFVLLCGSRKTTPAIEEILDKLKQPTPRGNTHPWGDFKWKDVCKPDGWIKHNSPFSRYAYYLCAKHGILTKSSLKTNQPDEEQSSQDDNPFFNQDFLEYLLCHVFPYTPLLDNSIFFLNGWPVENITNAIAECANKEIKINDFKPGELPMRLSRFLRRRHPRLELKMKLWETAIERIKKVKDPKASSQISITDLGSSQTKLKTNDPIEVDIRKVKAPKSSSQVTNHSLDSLNIKLEKKDPSEDDMSFKKDVFKKKQMNRNPRIHSEFIVPSLDVVPLLPWGGQVRLNNQLYDTTNTCSFDNTLVILYALSKTTYYGDLVMAAWRRAGNETEKTLQRIFSAMEAGNYVRAKSLWVFDVLEMQPPGSGLSLNCWNSEPEMGLNKLSHWFTFQKIYNCESHNCTIPKITLINTIEDLTVSDPDSVAITMNSKVRQSCTNGPCHPNKAESSYEFTHTGPPGILVYNLQPVYVGLFYKDSMMPNNQIIKGVKYDVFAYTLRINKNHFVTVFMTKSGKKKYDGMSSEKLTPHIEMCKESRVNTVWLVKCESQ